MSKRNPYDKQRMVLLDLLKQARKERGITQAVLSKKLGKPQSFVSKYENGERILDTVEIYQVCVVMDASFMMLMQQFNRCVRGKGNVEF